MDTKWLSEDEQGLFITPRELADRLAAEREKNADAHGYLVRLLVSVRPQIQPMDELLHVCTQIDNYIAGRIEEIKTLDSELAAEREKVAELEANLDDAARWIMVVGEELIMAGFPAGDRTIQLANLRTLIAELAKLRENRNG